MNLEQADKLVSIVEDAMRNSGAEYLEPLSYQPLVDDLVRLRLDYNRYRLDPTLIRANDETESAVSLQMVVAALGIIYSSLFLPLNLTRAIAEMTEGRFETRKGNQEGFSDENVPLILPLAQIRGDADVLDRLHYNFDRLVNAVIGYVADRDGSQAAAEARLLINRFLTRES